MVLAFCLGVLDSQAQTIAAPDLLAVSEIEELAALNPEPKMLMEVAKGHPVALVHGAATVGFIGQLSAGSTESEWRDWASTHRQGVEQVEMVRVYSKGSDACTTSTGLNFRMGRGPIAPLRFR